MYAFIDCNRGRYTVEMMAKVLRISPRSYYDHKRGIHNLREQKREALERLIQRVYAAAKGRYGAPRIAAEIQVNHHYVSVNTVSNTAMAGDKAAMFLQKDVASKFHPVGCNTVKSVFDHEFGHKLDALLGLRKNADFLRVYNEAVALGEQHVKESLSGYAYDKSLMKKRNYTPQAEFIAEAWSEYLNNSTPRPLAAAVGKFIENEYQKQKNRD